MSSAGSSTRAGAMARRGRDAAADPGGVRQRQPDRPGDRGQRTQRRLRRRALAAVRVRRQRRLARVLLQRRRPPDRPVRRLADGPGARRGAARGRLPGRLRRRVAAGSGSPPDAPVEEWTRRGHRGDDGPDPGDAGALPGRVRLLVPRAVAVRGRLGRPRHRAAQGRGPHLRAGRRAVVPLDRLRRRQGPGDRPLERRARPTSPATSPTSSPSWSAGSTPPCTCSAPTTTATRRG